MAHAVAEGSERSTARGHYKACARNMPPEIFAKAGGKTEESAPVATHRSWRITMPYFGTPAVLAICRKPDAYLLGLKTGGLWASGALYGKLGGVFSSAGAGGGESRPSPRRTALAHHGMVIVPWKLCRTGTCLTSPGVRGGARRNDYRRRRRFTSTKRENSLSLAIGEYVAGLAVKLSGCLQQEVRMPTQKQKRTASANGREACVIRRRKLPKPF